MELIEIVAYRAFKSEALGSIPTGVTFSNCIFCFLVILFYRMDLHFGKSRMPIHCIITDTITVSMHCVIIVVDAQ